MFPSQLFSMANDSANQKTLIQVEKGIKNPANQTLC
jgi:hypothetical protein